MRKLTAFILAVLFVFGSFGSIFAGTVTEHEEPKKTEITEPTRAVYSGTCGADLTWTLDTETGVLEITGTGDMTNWSSYSSVPWYSYRTSVKAVDIGNSVTSIGNYAFCYCTNLTSVTIGNSVTSIGDYAFYGCSKLTAVTIGSGVTSIGDNAFAYCESLTSINVDVNNQYYTCIDGVLFNKAVTVLIRCPGGKTGDYIIPSSVTSICDYAFSNCISLTSVTIGNSVTSIGEYTFYHCSSLTSVTIPDSVTSIGTYAFAYCYSLTSVTIGNGVMSTGGYAFTYCSSLTSVTIGNGVTSIGDYAFEDCSALTSVTIPDSVTSIGDSAFGYCDSLTAVTIGNGVTSIGVYAFSGCSSLTTVTIPDSVTSIGDNAFQYCYSLTSVTIGNGVTSIGSYAFEDCSSLTTVTIPDSVTSIGGRAFSSCRSLTSVTIPDSVTSIGYRAFDYCNSLTSVTIPDGVTSIGSYAFYHCTSLTSATFLGAPPSSFGSYVFDSCAPNFCIYYTSAHVSEWAPNGETTWNGYPIAKLGNSSGKLLVKFMLNTGSGSTYTTQVVDPGEPAYAPNNPRREGYTFRGWYSNPECTGQPWFNASNSFHGYPVYSNICLYAKWKPGFDIHEDWYSFNNSSDNFYHYLDQGLFYTPTYGKLITGEYKNALEKAFGSDKATLNGELDTKYNASCFGMSAVASLILANRITPSFFQSNCTTTFALKKPANNKAVRNLIEYYQILQSSPTTRIARTPDNTEEVNCKRVIDAIDSSNYPVVVGFNIYNWAGEKYEISGGHAVVACGYTLTDSAYRINIADPNRIGAFIHLDIERETYKNLGLDVTDYNNGTQRITFIKYALTVESLAYDHLNIQDYLTGKGYTSGAAAREIEDDVYTTLTTNFSSFRIDGSNGAYAVIEYGEKTEGELEIGEGQCMNEINSELQLEFDVPVLSEGASYTITPEECNSVVTDEPLEEYHASLVCSGENGFWADSTAGSGAEFVFGSDGSVSTTCTEPCAQSATVCRNDMTTDWSCVTVDSAETATLTAVPTSDSAAIIADPDAEYDITVSSFHNDAVFEGITGGALGVTVTEDEHKNAVITYNSNSAVAASGVFGCSLIFCTMGGSEIETQTGIVPGTTAAAPYDPTRTGMLFGGWYTTYGCEDGTEWSFDTPLTEDTYIYAKWEEDEDYIHSVTFHIEDGFDTIYYVYNGEALTDYELPEIPELEGYTAAWPELDLSCITEDIVIEPIYAPEPTLTPGDLDGDGLVTMADVTLLSMYLNGENPQITEPGMANADANEDGTVDIRDIAAIYAIIAAS